jgi:hypothetical protein
MKQPTATVDLQEDPYTLRPTTLPVVTSAGESELRPDVGIDLDRQGAIEKAVSDYIRNR